MVSSSDNQTRFNQNVFVDGDIDTTGDITLNGNLFLGGYISNPPVPDGLVKCDARFTDIVNTDESKTLSNVEFIDNFRSGQKIRIFNARSTEISQDLANSVTTLSLFTPTTDLDDSGDSTNFYYRVADFDLTNGQISQVNPSTYSINVKFPTSEFNVSRFVRISFTNKPSIDKAVLLYRRVGETGDYRLCAVLGPKEYNQSYIDYYTFDYTSWSGKRSSDNTYPDDTIYVPVNPPSSLMIGWTDATIEEVDYETNTITLEETVTVDNNNLNVNIAHNDTQELQETIDDFSSQGLKSLTLYGKTHIIEKLKLPNNFSLNGVPNFSKLKKMPWSGFEGDSGNNNIIFSETETETARITLDGIDIDGSVLEQVLFQDNSDKSINYAVDFGEKNDNCVFNNTRIYNVIGGGIYSPNSSKLKITESEVFNSGLTDRYDYSPIIANNSTDIISSGNLYQNFSDYVDFSLTYKGVAIHNIIENCGSGLYIFGSRFLLSSPNVLMGPANELLPSPDILNSEYDSVNITLQNNAPFISSVFTYQENGEAFNLKQNEDNELIYELWKLEKNSAGQENLYESITDVKISNVEDSSIDPERGEFQFSISQIDVNKIFNDYSFSDMKDINEFHRGLVYTASLKEIVNAGDIVLTGGSTGTLSDDENYYTISVENFKYLYEGALVTLIDHQGFTAFSDNENYGTISNIRRPSGSDTAIVTIYYDGGVDNIGQSTTNLGTINIINKFQLAKGQIL